MDKSSSRHSSGANNRLTLCVGSMLMCISVGFFGCGKGGKGSESPSFEGCPNDASEIGRLDWGLSEEQKKPVASGLLAAIELDRTVGAFDDELTEACGSLAKMLYAKEKDLEPEEFYLGALSSQACDVATENLKKLAGLAGGTFQIDVGPVLCSTKMDAAETCLSICAHATEVSCGGQEQGSCTGVCTGQCSDPDGGSCMGRCGGACDGSCDSEFDGLCRGKCEGTCNGEPSNADCDGTCQGRCLDGARGQCGGVCSGSCEGECTVQAAGECSGICSGECDVPLRDRTCAGPLLLPGDAGGCDQACDGELIRALKCTPPRVQVTASSAENEEAADLLERAMEQFLPMILSTRALNVDQDRLFAMSAAGEKEVATMKEVLQSPGSGKSEPSKRAKPCVSDQAIAHTASVQGVNSVLLAAEKARGLPTAID